MLALLDVSVSWLPAAGHRRGAPLSCPVIMQMRRGSRGPRAPPQRDVPMINEIIPHEEMRVMIEKQGESDEMLGIMRKEDAIAAARERDLDLVLIADKSEPVVCKIVSYDKYRFTKEKKAKEQKKASKNADLKELKMSYKIGDHDYDVRKRSAERFLSQGNPVKFSIFFRGREVAHTDVGLSVMERMAESLVEFGTVDAKPKIMGRSMIMMMKPKPKS